MSVPYAGQVGQEESVHSEVCAEGARSRGVEHQIPGFIDVGVVAADAVVDVCPVCRRRLPHLFAPCSSWQQR